MTTEAESRAASPPRATVEAAWRKWMIGFGRHLRRVRELLGLSQEELARLAGVSQGAVSRFESGRGLNTPFLLILRINMALARRLRGIDPSVLSDDAHRFLSHMDFFKPLESGAPPDPGGVPFAQLEILGDPESERLVRIYRDVPAARRAALLAIVEAAAAALRE